MSGMEAKSANALAKFCGRDWDDDESISLGDPLTALAYERKAREWGFKFDVVPPGEAWLTVAA